MKTSFSTTSLISFYLWFDNYVLQNGQGYFNNSSRFYYQADSGLPSNFVAYASPFKTFVWDSGVSGAIILNSVSGSAGTINRGSGMTVDFQNGRVLLDSSVGKTAIVSGSYAVKDFNLYFANQTQERLIFTNKYSLNSRFNRSISAVHAPNALVTPCIFISNTDSRNDPFAFGGIYNTNMNFTLNVFAETLGQLENLLALAIDTKDKIFPMVDTTIWPLNAYGDYKSGYNYEAILENPPHNGFFSVQNVAATKVSDYTKIDESIFLGIVDFTITKPRGIH